MTGERAQNSCLHELLTQHGGATLLYPLRDSAALSIVRRIRKLRSVQRGFLYINCSCSFSNVARKKRKNTGKSKTTQQFARFCCTRSEHWADVSLSQKDQLYSENWSSVPRDCCRPNLRTCVLLPVCLPCDFVNLCKLSRLVSWFFISCRG